MQYWHDSMQYSHEFTHVSQHKKMEHMQTITTNIRNGKARPRLENTTPVVRSPGVIVELESAVSGCGKNKQTKKKIHKVKVGNLES